MRQVVRRVYTTYCPECAENGDYIDQFEFSGQGEVKCSCCGKYYSFESLAHYDGEVKYIVEYV